MTSDGPRLAELLGGLSLACDLADGFPPGKVLRTAVLAVELGRRAGLSAADLRDTYYVTLLRYAGCTAFSHEEASLYGAGDDIALRETMSLADPADPVGTLRRVVRGIGRGAPLAARARAVARLLGDGVGLQSHARAQCEASVQIAQLVELGERICGALMQVCERWDGRGDPAHKREGEIDVVMRVHHMADVLELIVQQHGAAAACAEAKKRAGGHFDPELVRVFVAHHEELVGAGDDANLWQRFLDAEPAPHARAGEGREDAVARAFAMFADLKSVFTLGHSLGVAELAAAAGERIGLGAQDVTRLRHGALLHDLGRAAVPNTIWDKPGKLSIAEWERVRLHAYYTERVLARAPAWRDLAQVASGAHERSDSGGYHRGMPRTLLAPAARILAAADVYRAMCEARPHRPALGPARARTQLLNDVKAGLLDSEAVQAVIDAAEGAPRRARSTWPKGLTDREVEVLRLLARGRSNKEIGTALDCSPKTVQHHVAHVYGKIGVSSRAAAALFATLEGLLEPS